MISRQLTLDIRPTERPRFENFVTGGNAELVARLKSLASSAAFDAIYLWGEPGSGRSHLLEATRAAADGKRPTTMVGGGKAPDDLPVRPGGLLILDDVDLLGEQAQIALFRAFNGARLAGLALLIAGSRPPVELKLREDLRTRIGSALIYEVKPLDDDEKAETLLTHARQRGMRLDRDLVVYLLRHAPRDLPTLMAVLDSLDRISLEQQRPVTLPLLRDVLQSLGAPD